MPLTRSNRTSAVSSDITIPARSQRHSASSNSVASSSSVSSSSSTTTSSLISLNDIISASDTPRPLLIRGGTSTPSNMYMLATPCGGEISVCNKLLKEAALAYIQANGMPVEPPPENIFRRIANSVARSSIFTSLKSATRVVANVFNCLGF